ncbi:MAG: hypothetical protein P8124_12705, partial [Gammaproteobacteria bacterium]
MNSRMLTMAGALAVLPGLVYGEGVAVGGKVGSLGLGLEVAAALSPAVNARLGVNGFNYSRETTQSGVDYHAKLKLSTAAVDLDWYPMHGAFRTTVGLAYNRNEADLSGRPTNSQFVINGVTYQATDVAALDGSVTFRKLAPYVGIGWGNPVAPGKGWGFAADVGVLYQGSPQVGLNVTCGTGLNAAMCTQLQSDTEQERAQLASDLSRYKWYPVVSVGVSYR